MNYCHHDHKPAPGACDRLFLHCAQLRLYDFDGKVFRVRAPLPRKLQELLQRLVVKKKVGQPVGWGKEIYKKKWTSTCVCVDELVWRPSSHVCFVRRLLFARLVRVYMEGLGLGCQWVGRSPTNGWPGDAGLMDAVWCHRLRLGVRQSDRETVRLHFAHWCFCVCGGVGVWSVWSWNCNENVTF